MRRPDRPWSLRGTSGKPRFLAAQRTCWARPGNSRLAENVVLTCRSGTDYAAVGGDEFYTRLEDIEARLARIARRLAVLGATRGLSTDC